MNDKKKAKRITITQVAQHAGVTIGTVSHVVNGTAPISPETTEKVLASIKELNYIPNATARSLRSKKKYTIGFMIPSLNNSFHAKAASVFVERAYAEGYSVQIYGYEYSMEREYKEMSRLEGNDIGVIIIFNGYGDEKEILALQKKEIPVILADRYTEIPGVSYIKFENKRIMYDMVSMLKKKEYQKIGFFSEPIHLTNIQERFYNYQQALAYYGYEYHPDYVFAREDLSFDNLKNGYLFMKEILNTHSREELPDVFIASSDLLAIGLMHAIYEKGYQIPGDFGVIGFGNTDISGYINPRLTTVEQNQNLLGEQLMEMVKQINNKESQIENLSLKQSLVIRESC